MKKAWFVQMFFKEVQEGCGKGRNPKKQPSLQTLQRGLVSKGFNLPMFLIRAGGLLAGGGMS